MKLTFRAPAGVWLVSVSLLGAWGCEDGDNFAPVAVDRKDATAGETQVDQSAPAPEVMAERPADTTDTEPDVPISVDSGVDAGHDPLPDASADGPKDSSVDESLEVPADVGEATCPGSNCPLAIAPGHLQLWLSADDDTVDCQFNGTIARVRQWRDRSGNGNHAGPASNQVGPLCGPSAAKLNGRNVVTFPRTMGQENGEHLEVSLASIQDRPFTVVIVERRPDVVDSGAWLLGGTLENPYDACAPGMPGPNAGRVLQLGYGRRWQRRVSTWGPSCGVVADGPPQTDGGPPDPKTPGPTLMWVVTLSADKQLSFLLNGRKVGEAQGEGLVPKGTMAPLTAFIGRGAQPLVSDNRFKGDIAEILIFDVALNDEQRRALEQHLEPRWDFAITN